MGYHHLAFATRDLEANHAFYTEAMGFELVKAVVGPTEAPGGWAKHLFYDTGGDGMIAFWELHDQRVPADFDPRISEGLGLPSWEEGAPADLVVYDGDPEARQKILAGSALKADVVQYPREIGKATANAVADYLEGKKVPAFVPVETGIVDRESLSKGE